MLICIPTHGDAGLDDTVCEHFGSAPYFTLFNSETEDLRVVPNHNAHHSHGTCHPMNQLTKYHIDAVICGGMGRRAIEALSVEGVSVYAATSDNVHDVVLSIKTGNLEPVDPARACRGRGQQPFIHEHHASGRDRSRRGQGRGAGRGQTGRGR